MKLEPNLVVAELPARQPRPFDRVLAFLDKLFRFASLIVEGDDPLCRVAQVGDDEADTRNQFAGMPFDLGDDAAFLSPLSGLIAEAGARAPHMARRTSARMGRLLPLGPRFATGNARPQI